jgi:hypothetical protein
MGGSSSVIQLRLCCLKRGFEHEHEHDNEHDFWNGSDRGYRRFSISTTKDEDDLDGAALKQVSAYRVETLSLNPIAPPGNKSPSNPP